uniref:Uncharacterized protein n=1 Tax=Cacopsylla melanoneura TaxID=428564 RepID=A0A8D8Z570_9HEMI
MKMFNEYRNNKVNIIQGILIFRDLKICSLFQYSYGLVTYEYKSGKSLFNAPTIFFPLLHSGVISPYLYWNGVQGQCARPWSGKNNACVYLYIFIDRNRLILYFYILCVGLR